jgi:translocation and assembly module TamB
VVKSRRWRVALLLGALGALSLVFALRTERAGDWACQTLRTELPQRIPFEVAVGHCQIEPLAQAVRLTDLALSDPQTHKSVLAASEAYVSLRSIFLSSVTFDHLKLLRPRANLDLSKRGPTTKGGSCPLDLLKRLKVEHLELHEGSLILALPQSRQLQLDGLDLDWRIRRSTLELQAVMTGGRLKLDDERTATLGKALVEGELDVGDEKFSVTRAEANVEGARISVTGTLESLCDPFPVLALNAQLFTPLSSAARLVGSKMLQPAEGHVWSRALITGRADTPTLTAQVQGSEIHLGQFKPGDFTAKVRLNGDELKVEEFFTRSGPGTVKVSGEIKLTPGFPVKARVETEDASFARILERAGVAGAWVEFPATVRTSLSGNLSPRVSLTGDVDLKTSRFVLAARPWDAPTTAGPTILTFPQGHAALKLGIYSDRVEFSSIHVQAGLQGATAVHGDVTLYFDVARGIEVKAAADALQLSDFGAIAEIPWAGQGVASVNIAGPYAGVKIDGQVALRDFEMFGYAAGVVQGPIRFSRGVLGFPSLLGQKGKTGFSARADLQFRPDGLFIDAEAGVPRGRTEDLVDLIAHLHPSIAAFQQALEGDATGTLRFLGPAKAVDATIALELAHTRYYGRSLGEGRVTLQLEKGSALVLEPAALVGTLGKLSAEGRWSFSGPLDFKLKLDQGSLGEAIGAELAGAQGISGDLTLEGSVTGDTNAPVVSGYLRAPQVLYGKQPVGPMQLEARMEGRELHVFGRLFDGAQGQARMKVKEPYPWEGTVALDVPDARAFLPPAASRQGTTAGLKGSISGNGNLKSIDDSHLMAELSSLAVQRGELSATNDGPVVIKWDAGRLELTSFSVRGPNTALIAEGTWGPVNADLKAQGSVDLRLLESFVPQLERTSGRVELTALLSGTVKVPALVGSAEVHDAKFQVRDQALAVRALSGKAEFSEARILLQDFEGFLNDGRVRGRGDVRLDRFEVRNVELAMDLEEVTLQPRIDLPTSVAGSLIFLGKPGAFQLAGSLNVLKLRYTQPLDLERLLHNSSLRLPPSDDRPTEWLRYDVDLDGREGDIRIDNNLAKARLTGKLKLAGTNVKPVLLGSFETVEGGQAYFRGQAFSISRGLVQFGAQDTTFDLTAQSQVREYLVRVKGFGKLEDPKLALSSEPALPEADVVSLLTLGVTSRERATAEAGAGLAAEALLSATGLEREVQRFLKKSVALKDQQLHLSTTFNEATGQAEPSVSWESKVVTDKLKVGVTQPVTGRGTRAQAEYKFNDQVSARAQWDNQSQESSVGNPGVELKFRFEWE